jgi:hypothetical protein
MDKQEFVNHVVTRYNQDPNGRLSEDARHFIESENFSIRVVTEEVDLSWSESYIGTSFGSTQDYGRRWNVIMGDETANQWANKGNSTEADLIDEVRERVASSPRQIDFYNKDDETVVTGVVVHLKKTGYAIYPDPEEFVEPTL